jgi:hypothetical protein
MGTSLCLAWGKCVDRKAQNVGRNVAVIRDFSLVTHLSLVTQECKHVWCEGLQILFVVCLRNARKQAREV